MRWDRRTILAAGSAALFLPWLTGSALSQDRAAAIDALYQAAKEEGELTWYVAHHSSEVAERMGRVFTETYPGVEVNVVRTTAQVAYQRLNQDIDAGVNNCDVFASTVVAHFIDLKERGLLLSYEPVRKNEVYEQFRDVDEDNTYHIVSVGPINIVYNTDLVTREEAPKTWQEMNDPKWEGKVASGHPGYSGYVGNWVVLMRDLYGWEYFEKLAANDPYVGRSIIDVATTVVAGERAVGAGPGTTALLNASKGNPIANIYPEDGTVVITSPAAIMKDAQHPNAAKLFMEFLMGPENAAIQADEFAPSIIKSVPSREGVADFADIQTITATKEQLIDGIPEVSEMWRDLFGI